jgi:hypothetical protein
MAVSALACTSEKVVAGAMRFMRGRRVMAGIGHDRAMHQAHRPEQDGEAQTDEFGGSCHMHI